MKCPECKAKIPNHLSLCPECGTMVEETLPMRALRRSKRGPTIEVEEPQLPVDIAAPKEPKPSVWPKVRRAILWGIGFICIVLLSVSLATYFAIQQAEQENAQERLEEVDRRYQEGLTYLESGEYERAIADFEYVLRLEPEHPFAEQRIAEAEAGIAARPTPTLEMQEIVASDLYVKAKAHYEAEEWDDAASVLSQLRVLDPEYEAVVVEDMLFNSLYNAGMALLAENRFEEGIFYLDQAVALRPLDEEALTQRSLAVQYMTALGYWGVDWERCIERFGQIYVIAPGYKDVFRRLYDAHVTYGDAWYAQDEMCPAEEEYAEALALIADPDIQQKRTAAAEVCAVATPAPIEGTHALTLTQMPPGFNAGRLAYPVYNTQTGIYDVYALFIDGRLIRMASGADQPQWVWNTGALGFRNLLTPGIALQIGGEPTPRQLTTDGGMAWPSFSPDGSRMTYAVQDAAGTWQVYIAPTDGSAEAKVHAVGKGPVWGPTGWLAWTGCEASGACGVFVDNPDDDQPPTRRTASANDVGLSWSPNGGSLVYMSDVTGNWDIYMVSIEGGVILLTEDPASDGLPAYAPDGSSIAFVSNRDGSWALYLMDPDGQNTHKILTLGPNLPGWTKQRISWAP